MKISLHIKKNLFLSFPIMLSQLGHITVGVVDSIMVGKLGVTQLAAVSLSSSIFGFVLLFCIGLSFGITPLIASSNHNQKYISRIFFHGLVMNILFSIFLIFLVFFFKKYLHYLGQDYDVLNYTFPYLDLICLSLIPLILFQTFKQFIEGLGFTKPAMYISIFSNIINIILNFILIFGLFGFPRLEIIGAGYATLISRIIMFILILIYCLLSKKFSKYIFSIKLLFHTKSFKKIFNIGFPSGLQYIFEVGAFSVATVMIGTFGAKALAAHQIALNLASISYMTISGISSSAMISLGYFYGKNDHEELRKSGHSNFYLALILMSVFALIFIFCRNLLPQLYITDSIVIEIASTLLIIAGLFQIPDGIQAVGLGVLRGIRDTKVPTFITFVCYWVFAIPLSYYLGFILELGVVGIWVSLFFALTFAAISHFIRFNYLTDFNKI